MSTGSDAVGSDRIDTLDVIRGVAVMGILLANLPAFGLPTGAYFSPLPAGGTELDDRIAWALNFVLVEGKMRGLFSLLFGASLLLVVERAEASGESGLKIHYSRMFWLFVIGCLHLYLFWWGDILAHYALVGSAAFLFRRMEAGRLIAAGVVATLAGWLFSLGGAFIAFGGGAEAAGLLAGFGGPDPDAATEVAAMRGGFADGVRLRWAEVDILGFLLIAGLQTLGAMLWGMAALKSAFLTGGWDRDRYRRWAAVTLAAGLAGYAALAAVTIGREFDPRFVFLNSIVLAEPFRPLLIVGYACLAMLLVRPGEWLTERIEAVGRAALTNYLGATLLMTFVFNGWGLGWFARIGRAEMYLLALLAWGLMLLWSKPWLERYRHGPMEWAWRSVARGSVQPFRINLARTS